MEYPPLQRFDTGAVRWFCDVDGERIYEGGALSIRRSDVAMAAIAGRAKWEVRCADHAFPESADVYAIDLEDIDDIHRLADKEREMRDLGAAVDRTDWSTFVLPDIEPEPPRRARHSVPSFARGQSGHERNE